MKQTDPNAPWHRRYRMLMGIYLIALAVGVREYWIARQSPSVDMLSDEWAAMSEVVEAVNPDHPDTEFLESIQAMRQGDATEFMRLMEEALASGVKHNDLLMQTYAQQLLVTGVDYRRVNFALNSWRGNHPHSSETIWIPLAIPPTNPAETAVLHRALGEVQWIAQGELETVTQGATSSVRVRLSFRPPHEVDIREAVAAVTTLSLSEDERRRYRVRCITLTDCDVVPR